MNLDKSALIAAGYRVSVNIDAALVTKCASSVKQAYLLHYVTEAEITAATATDVIGKCWLSLTFLRLILDTEFATRTGGERKNMEWGQRAYDYMHTIKSECHMALEALEAAHPHHSAINDICEVYFKTQIFG